MILMATLLFVFVSTASTTLPNVPWPSSRTVRSIIIVNDLDSWIPKKVKLTLSINQIVGHDNIMTLLVVARHGAFGSLNKDSLP